MPQNVPKFHFHTNESGELYGCDVMEIKGNQHLIVFNYKSVCIFKRKLPNVTSTSVIEALKSIFCDVRAPDKLISDNVRYFVSDEFEEFTKWNIVHVTLSPRYPQGNSHIEKEIQSVKAIYEKCHDIKMGHLMLKTTPVISGHDHKAPAETIFRPSQWTSDHNRDEHPMMMSKFRNHDTIWCKVDPNTKWKPGHIIDILFNRTWRW